MNNRPHVLILEDVTTDAELIEGQLRKAGVCFTAKRVETKEAFLEAIANFAPDILLSTYMLPQFNGIEALRLLREHNLRVPFIFVTGSWTKEIAVECMKEGADDFIPKTSLERLPAALLNALEKGAARRTSDDAIARLRRREHKLADFIDHATIGLHWAGADGVILWANRAELELLGYAPEEYIGRHITEFYADREVIDDILGRLTANEELRDYEARLRCKDGSIKHVHINSNVLREDGEFVHTRCFTRDITARKQAEEAVRLGHEELERRVAQRTAELVSANELLKEEIAERQRAEKALRDSEDFAKGILESNPDCTKVLDLEGKLLYMNPSGQQLMETTDFSSCVNLSWIDFWEGEARQEALNALAEAKAGSTGIFEGYCPTALGTPKWWSVIVSPIRDASGRIERLLSVSRDITERKLVEQKLKQSEDWLRAIFDASRDGILVEDNGCIVYVNNAYTQMLGYAAPEQLVGVCISALVTPDDAERMMKYGEARLRGETPPSVYEFNAKRKDGSLLRVEGAVSTSVVAGKTYITTAIRDITERKRAEEALRESERRYRFLGEGILHQVWTAQPDGNLDYVNERTLEYFGFTMEQGLGERWLNAVHPDDVPVCAERWARSLQTGEHYEVEFRLRRADGEYRWHLGRATAGYDAAGNLVKWFGTNTDINNQKLAEEALRRSEEQLRQSQKLEAVGRLAGGIAHDFNNLLTAITGYSDLTLRCLAPDNPLHHNVTEIKKAGERAAALTRQLLAFSRKQILQPKVLDLNSIVTDISKILQRVIGEDVNILTVLDPHLSYIEADAGQLEQVLMNLAVNARDAMPGGGKLTIQTANVELSDDYAREHPNVPPGSYVMLAISDAGCGMDAATQAQIFEPFFTTKAAGKGTGLGLATVYGIVKQSGGNIWVYSEVGHGTTFKIYLPCARKAAELIEKAEPRAALPRGTETILLVEDEEAVRELLREVLEADGYSVLLTSGGEEALQLCRSYKKEIHLMLTDVVMPGMNGRELGEHAAALRPEMKVLYMSGYTDEAITHHGVLDAGVAFLEKPFTPDSVARKVREVLNESRKIHEGMVEQADALKWETAIN